MQDALVEQPAMEVVRQLCDVINMHQARHLQAQRPSLQEGVEIKPHVCF